MVLGAFGEGLAEENGELTVPNGWHNPVGPGGGKSSESPKVKNFSEK